VTSLETVFGHPLFERRNDGYTLTPQGRILLDKASAMEEAALAALQSIETSSELNGLVRLTATRALADGFLVDHLGPLHDIYPDVVLELVGDARMVSLAKREADIALRLGSFKDSDLIARRVAQIAFGLYASPAYYDKLRSSGQPPEFIGYDRDSDFIFEASWLTHQFPSERFVFRTNSQMSQAAAARAGFGVALLPQFLAANDSRLMAISLEVSPLKRDLWLVTRRDVGKAPLIRAVIDYLVEVFRRERQILANE
jgi:DNA-binding transcriptional LysR family regulator